MWGWLRSGERRVRWAIQSLPKTARQIEYYLAPGWRWSRGPYGCVPTKALGIEQPSLFNVKWSSTALLILVPVWDAVDAALCITGTCPYHAAHQDGRNR